MRIERRDGNSRFLSLQDIIVLQMQLQHQADDKSLAQASAIKKLLKDGYFEGRIDFTQKEQAARFYARVPDVLPALLDFTGFDHLQTESEKNQTYQTAYRLAKAGMYGRQLNSLRP